MTVILFQYSLFLFQFIRKDNAVFINDVIY